MKLIDYIGGDRRGKGANDLEKRAMDDPFLSDAVEGYDAVYGNHFDMVKKLEEWVDSRSMRRRQSRLRTFWAVGSAAALVLGGVAVAYYFYNDRNPGAGNYSVAEVLRLSPPADEISMTAFRDNISDNIAKFADPVAGAIVPDSSFYADAGAVDPVGSVARADIIARSGGVAKLVAHESAEAEWAANVVSAALESDPVSGDLREDAGALVAAADMQSAVEEEAPQATIAPENPILSAAPVGNIGEEAAIGSAGQEGMEMVVYSAFDEYFRKNRRLRNDPHGNPLRGDVVLEFRVNDAGVPSAIRVVSSFSQEANQEAMELLISGPRWNPTYGRRIRTVIVYR